MSARRSLLLIPLVVLALTSVALAQTSGGYLTGGNLGVGVSVPGGSSSSGTGSSGTSSSGGGGGGPVPTCTATSASGDDITGPEGYRPASAGVTESLNANPTGSNVLSGRPTPTSPGSWYLKTCGGATQGFVWVPQGTTPGPPPPPPAPTAAELNDRIPLPTPTVGVSPRVDGLAGLPTWLWDPTPQGARTVTATIRGWTATATANPGTWSWRMYDSGEPGPASQSNPPPNVSATQPGSEASPAATFTYETPGAYTLTITVSWSGSFTYSRPGFSPVTAPLGTSTRDATRTYTVGAISPVVVSSRT